MDSPLSFFYCRALTIQTFVEEKHYQQNAPDALAIQFFLAHS